MTSLPSDYSDVQPRNYDPDYISDISNRMQVPDTIPAYTGGEMNGDSRSSSYDDIRGHQMNVPERIMVAGRILTLSHMQMHFDASYLSTFESWILNWEIMRY